MMFQEIAKNLRFSFAATLVFVAFVSSQASAGVNDHVRPVEGDLATFLRSNPSWSWAWFEANADHSLSSELIKFTGVVGGDIKPDNVDIVGTKKSAALGLIDLDDGGRGSFVGDLFHSLVYNEVWHTQISFAEAFDLYRRGLLGKKAKIETSLEDILEKQKEKEYDLEKAAQSQQNFLTEFKLVKIKDAPAEMRRALEASKKDIESDLASEGEILYVGAKVKKSGGSAGMPRFYFLLASDKGLKAIEYKMQGAPAVAAHNSRQLSTPARINELLEWYRPAKDDNNPILGTLKTTAGTYLVREPRKPSFDAGDEPTGKKDIKRYEDYIRHMFYWLGEIHGQQNEKYAKAFDKNSEDLAEELRSLVRDHIAEARRIHGE